MIGCITAEAVAESNKAAYMAAGAGAMPGVPSAAERRIGRGQADPVSPVPPEPMDTRTGSHITAGEFRRPYVAEGHAAESPANVPGYVAPVPPDIPGVPSRVHYSTAERQDAREAMEAVHDDGGTQGGAAKAVEPVRLSWRAQVHGAGPVADSARNWQPQITSAGGAQ